MLEVLFDFELDGIEKCFVLNIIDCYMVNSLSLGVLVVCVVCGLGERIVVSGWFFNNLSRSYF